MKWFDELSSGGIWKWLWGVTALVNTLKKASVEPVERQIFISGLVIAFCSVGVQNFYARDFLTAY